MHPTVYIETTIVSYLVARPSRDAIMAARQRQTREWWATRRGEYRLVTSDLVLREAGRGEPAMARARLAVLAPLHVLAETADVLRLRDALLTQGPLPSRAREDATHIAFAAVYRVDLLLTWNCRHIANPRMRSRIVRICAEFGLALPEMITPDLLLMR